MTLAVLGFPLKPYAESRPIIGLHPHQPIGMTGKLPAFTRDLFDMSAVTRDAASVNKTANSSIKSPMPRPAISADPGPPSSSSFGPHSQVLKSVARRNPSPHNTSALNLRYQSMAIVDPSSANQGTPISVRKHSYTRVQPPRTSPGPRVNKLEAVPGSWASRPSNLRPNYLSQGTTQSNTPPRTGVRASRDTPSPAPRVTRPNAGLYSRSNSADRTSRTMGPRMPRQPTAKRLSLGMTMTSSRLAGRPYVATAIRSIPSSPSTSPSLPHQSPLITRLPFSGSPDYKRETSPPFGQAPPWLSTSSTPSSSPRPPASLPRPTFSSGTSSSLSNPVSPSRSPPAIFIVTNTATTSVVSDIGKGLNIPESPAREPKRASSPDSPTSVLSYASLTIFTSGSGRRKSVGSNDGSIKLAEVEKRLRHTPEPDSGYQMYEWGVEEIGYYNDQLLRFTTSHHSSASDLETYRNEEHVEVFVDNVYSAERSPSPIVYARSETDDSDDDYGVLRRRRRILADEANSRSKHASSSRPSTAGNPTRPALGPDFFALSMKNAVDGRRSKQGSSNHVFPKESISYHTDNPSLSRYSTRSRGKRRDQFRRSSVIPTSKSSETVEPLTSHHLAPPSKETIIEVPRSPSPILYARRRSLDFIDLEDIDITNDSSGAARWKSFGPRQGGSIAPHGFLSEPSGGDILGKRIRRRTMQPKSFLHGYSTPPAQHLLSMDLDNKAKEKEGEKVEKIERGRGRERTERGRGRKKEHGLVPISLVNYNKVDKKRETKEREKIEKEMEKPRTRKTSRGIFDELATVTSRNVIAGRKQAGDYLVNSRSRSPKGANNRNKEKEKWKWALWDRDVNMKERSERGGGGYASTCGTDSVDDDSVLDIVGDGDDGADGDVDDDGWSTDEKKQRHSLAGLEFR